MIYMPHTCTYWAGTPDGFGGYNWAAPVVLNCRWRDKQRLIRAKDGEEKVSRSEVILSTPISLTSRLLLGESSEVTPPEGAGEPQAMETASDISGTLRFVKVWL